MLLSVGTARLKVLAVWLPDSIRVPLHMISDRARHRARAVQSLNQAPSLLAECSLAAFSGNSPQKAPAPSEAILQFQAGGCSLQRAPPHSGLDNVFDRLSKMPIDPTTTSLHQQDPIAGQQKAKEYSCHTPRTEAVSWQQNARRHPAGIAAHQRHLYLTARFSRAGR